MRDVEIGKDTKRKEDNKGGEVKTSYIVTVQDNGSPVFYQVCWVHRYSHHFQHFPFFHVGGEDAKMSRKNHGPVATQQLPLEAQKKERVPHYVANQ